MNHSAPCLHRKQSVRPRKGKGWILALFTACFGGADGHAGVVLDGSLGKTGSIAGPTYRIPATAGRQLGNTLFHSFSTFDVGKGESAIFYGPASVRDILTRVTGGSVSSIDGMLSSNMPGANLYLINPAGLVFGPGASVDVDGAFHAGTADYLKLGGNGHFDASTPAQSVLVSAPPTAFGFLGSKPAPIEVTGSWIMAPAGISLMGGDITLRNHAWLFAPGGHVRVIALASPGLARPGTTPANFQWAGADRRGNLRILDSTVSTGGGAGGAVILRAGDMILRDARVTTRLEQAQGDAGQGGGLIDVDAGALVMERASISSTVQAKCAGNTPVIRIKAGRVGLEEQSWVGVETTPGSSGTVGGIKVQAGDLQISQQSQLVTSAAGAEVGGIDIQADSVDIGDQGGINSQTFGAGSAGDVTVNARALKLSQGGVLSTSVWDGAASPGDLVIHAGDLTLSNTSGWLTMLGTSSAVTAAAGEPGNVHITADRIRVSGMSQIHNTARGPRDAGALRIAADDILLTGGGLVNANANGDGDGGEISIRSDRMALDTYASIRAESLGDGRGGTIHLAGGALQLSDHAYLSANAYGPPGDGGGIFLDMVRITLAAGAQVLASASGQDRTGGDIVINTGTLSITGYESSAYPFTFDFTGLEALTSDGPGGSIRIQATEKVALVNRATLVTSSGGAGRAGSIHIQAPALELKSGAQINSSAFSTGAGGDIDIIVDDLLLSGVHPQPFLSAGQEMLAPSAVAAQTVASGPAGRVTIQAGRLRLLDGARISAETLGSGAGGHVVIEAGEVLVSGRNADHHAYLLEQGQAPEWVETRSRTAIAVGSRPLGHVLPSGTGGDVVITAGRLAVTDGGLILSDSMGSGKGGDITLDASQILLATDGRISARGNSSGPAGNLHVTARERFSSRGGVVSTESASAGGGGMTFRVGRVFHLADSAVTTSVQGGGGSAGNIDIDPTFVALDDSRIAANAHGGSGGNIRIVSDYFLTSGASVVEASSELGVDGTVRIETAQTQVAEGLEGPRADYLDPSALLRARCAPRVAGRTSTFTVSGQRGFPPDPERPAWSDYSSLIGLAVGAVASPSRQAVAGYRF